MAAAGPPSVCVIGAGCSGLAAARALRDAGVDFVVVERKDDVGGLWRYRPTAGERAPPRDGTTLDDCGASPMYRDLTTNLSKVAMSFHDLPFPDEVPDLPNLHRSHVLDYISRFADAHDLRRRVEFATAAAAVERDGARWRVTTRSRRGAAVRHFRHVVVASGHYAAPHVPRIAGAAAFPGRVLHSCSFDRPEEFAGRDVLLYGGAVSAGDIAQLLLRRGGCRSVRVAVRAPPATTFRKLTYGSVQAAGRRGAPLHPDIARLTAGGRAEFADGSGAAVDAVICATGYKYNFPFLRGTVAQVVDPDGWNVRGLYHGMFPPADPSICFIGLHNVLLGPNQVFEAQARLMARVARDGAAAVLPPRAAMEAAVRAEEASAAAGDRVYLGLRTGAYCAALAALAGVRDTFRALDPKSAAHVKRGNARL